MASENRAETDATGANDEPGRIRKLLHSPITWATGVLGAVLGGILIAWGQSEGRDLVDRATATEPVQFSIIQQDFEGDFALQRPIDDPADRAEMLTGESDAIFALLGKYGGGPVGRLDVTLVVEGGRSSVRVVDIKPRITRKLPVLKGAYYATVSAGQADVIQMTSHLDAKDKRFRSGKGSAKELYFSTKQIDLKRGERETLLLTFHANKAAYEFDLVVTVSADGQEYQQKIARADGSPFRVTGAARGYRSYERVYRGGGSTWRSVDRQGKCKIFPRSKGC